MADIRALRLNADGTADVLTLDNYSSRSFHDAIGGYMDVIYLRGLTTDPMASVIGLVDEDGWRNQPQSNYWSFMVYHQPVAGPIVIVRAEPGGDFIGLTDDDMQTLRGILGSVIILTSDTKGSTDR